MEIAKHMMKKRTRIARSAISALAACLLLATHSIAEARIQMNSTGSIAPNPLQKQARSSSDDPKPNEESEANDVLYVFKVWPLLDTDEAKKRVLEELRRWRSGASEVMDAVGDAPCMIGEVLFKACPDSQESETDDD